MRERYELSSRKIWAIYTPISTYLQALCSMSLSRRSPHQFYNAIQMKLRVKHNTEVCQSEQFHSSICTFWAFSIGKLSRSSVREVPLKRRRTLRLIKRRHENAPSSNSRRSIIGVSSSRERSVDVPMISQRYQTKVIRGQTVIVCTAACSSPHFHTMLFCVQGRKAWSAKSNPGRVQVN